MPKNINMTQILLNIQDKQMSFFKELIKNFDFVSVEEIITNDKTKSNDINEYSLTNDQISVLEERKQKHISNESKSYNWDDIKQELKSH